MSESFIVIAGNQIYYVMDGSNPRQKIAQYSDRFEAYAHADRLNTDMKPYVGMPATHHIGSDSYGGRIIAVSKTGHRVTWQRVASDGTSQANFVHEYSRRRDGRYLEIGSKHGTLELGIARTVLDEGF